MFIKSYNGIITNFHNNKIPKEDSKFICLSVILIDSVFRTDKSYPQVEQFLEQCKYVVNKKKEAEYVTDDIEISSDLIEKILMKKFPMNKILMKKIKYKMRLFLCLKHFE